MQHLTQPRWLFLVHTLPIAVLLGLCYSEFAVINTLLPPESLAMWRQLALVLGALVLSTAGYAAWQLGRGRAVGPGYAVLALLAHIACLWWATSQNNVLVPREVPQWMLPSQPLLLGFTFLMPVLVHALFVLVAWFTPADRPHRAWRSFVLAVAVPAGWYLVLVVPQKLWASTGLHHWVEYGLAAALICSTISFLFFLVRGVYILGLRQSAEAAEWHIVWKLLLALVFPLLGLAVNNGLLFSIFGSINSTESGIFGNFNSPWFYGLALLNGVLLCVPTSRRPAYRLLLLLGRSSTLAYTFYFFLVFLPFLPLSVLAVIAVGTGFLMLTPLLLLVLHVRELSADYHFLQPYFPRWQLRAAVVAGVLVLPLGITASYWHQRQVLHEALNYLYSPNYSQARHLDETALARTLHIVRRHKERNQNFMFGSQQPYLSLYFNWLVLDNLTLAESKMRDMEQVFLGEPQPATVGITSWVAPEAPRAALQRFGVRSTYDKQQQAWVSWVDLAVANPTGAPATQANEYATELELPAGCWINGYYLDINGRREPGILAEKKAAHWVFSQIVNTNRDPGILHYLSGNRVALRVFPVTGAETRTTGIRFVHKEPVVLALDNRRVPLGDTTAAPLAAPVATPDSAVVYLSAAAKQRLPLVQRRPYYHFLLDISQGKAMHKAAYARQVQALLKARPLPAPPRFSLVNAYDTPVPSAEWPARLRQAPNEGGLYLNGAIRRVLADAWQRPAGTYPVLVVVTDKLSKAVLTQDFADLSSAYPEAPWFYHLGLDGALQPHDLRRNPRQIQPESAVAGSAGPVRAWPRADAVQAYLPDNGQAAIVLNKKLVQVREETSGATAWQTGLLLHGYSQWQALHPETTEAERVPAIRASFRAGIMTPFTSYIALENEAQKAALRRKQAQTLNANAALDAGEETPPTAVPLDGGASLLLLAGAGLGVRQLRRRKAAAPRPTA